jgi:hypothetical protein
LQGHDSIYHRSARAVADHSLHADGLRQSTGNKPSQAPEYQANDSEFQKISFQRNWTLPFPLHQI